jgi:uncharacterized protein YdiU (UPF0061 family)
VGDLLAIMADNRADFTLTFRRLSDVDAGDPATIARVADLFEDPGTFDDWAARWIRRLESAPQSAAARRSTMRAVNPLYIARNHRVEEAIAAALGESNFAPFRRLLEVLRCPYEEQPSAQRYAEPPRPEEIVHQTFCGT